jgi:hypothetical protein
MELAVAFCHTALMVAGTSIGCRLLTAGRVAVVLLSGIFWGVVGRGIARAQDEPKVVDGGVPTLHVYTNLIQIPTLVLGPSREFIKRPIAENRFSVSIDEGPWFPAIHVRPEGDDPIALSILLDVNGDTAVLMPKISEALAELARSSLHPQDRISLYAMDCALMRSLAGAPVDSAQVKRGADAVLEPWTLRKRRKQSCQQSIHLWDALAVVEVETSKLSGRRVILAITDGQDRGSKHNWNELAKFAQDSGTAIFGLHYVEDRSWGGPTVTRRGGGGQFTTNDAALGNVEDAWSFVTESSGGIVTTTSDTKSLGASLGQVLAMVRGRYIVEFPRPSNSTAGSHEMQVKVAKSNYMTRPSGISVPMPDAALAADPTTIQSGPLVAPEQGKPKSTTKPK